MTALIAGAFLATAAATALAGEANSPVPQGCALGIAGPALGPATSLREARDAAFAALAAERLPVRLESEVNWRRARVREVSHEEVHGRLQGIRIEGLRGYASGRVDAIACGPGADLHALDRRWPHSWPRALTRQPGCALGIAGLDLDSDLRARSARGDAIEMLARMREVEVHHVLRLDGGRRIDRARAVRSTAPARAAVLALETDLTEQRWLDRDGRGPLGRPDVLYLQLCPPAG